MVKLYIVRHSKTQWNMEKRVQGHTDIPLNEEGLLLAKKTGAGMAHIPFDFAWCSPLLRAKETAQAILAGRTAPVLKEDERLKELGFGIFEGLCCLYGNPDPLCEKFRLFYKDTARYRPEGGAETIEALYDRLESFLSMVSGCDGQNPKETKNVLVVTHGAAMNAMLNLLSDGRLIDGFWSRPVAGNCGTALVELEAGGARIVYENRSFAKEPSGTENKKSAPDTRTERGEV